METLITLSLALNAVVLTPVVILMANSSKRVEFVWGPFTPARGILQSVYFAILAMSVLLLITPVTEMVFALLAVQVVYKLTTPFTVRTLRNPVVLSNLGISILHIATLTAIYSSGAIAFSS